MLKSGLVSVSFRKFGVEKILHMCEKARLDCIEWGGDTHVVHGDTALAEKVARMSADAGIEIAAYGSYYRAGFSENSRDDFLDFQAVLNSALALGAKTIRVWAGSGIKSDEVNAAQRREIVDDLLRIGEMAARYDLNVSMEFHGGTLTDCNESATRLKDELPDTSNVDFYWQPKLGYSDEECIDGIRKLTPRITNIHVFHWLIGADGQLVKQLLEPGREHWIKFLDAIDGDGGKHAAMLEFFVDDSEESFYKDAATLKQIITEL
jgi:sugar phosphate isomerase/epimerase